MGKTNLGLSARVGDVGQKDEAELEISRPHGRENPELLNLMVLLQKVFPWDPASLPAPILDWLQRYGHWGQQPAQADPLVQLRNVSHQLAAPDPATRWQRLDPTGLDAAALGPFLRWLDLSRPDLAAAPQHAELAISLMLGESGQVSRVWRDVRARTWGQAEGVPMMPEETVVPHLVHTIWPGAHEHFAEAARRCHGEADFVVWTDVSRVEAIRALDGGRLERDRRVRSLMAWARENQVLVVHGAEVLGPGWSVAAGRLSTLRQSVPTARQLAMARDHLRLEIVSRLGGACLGLGNHLDSPGSFRSGWFEAVAASPVGFEAHLSERKGFPVLDVLAAPPQHPALHLWQELARLALGIETLRE
ncbi:hypothetical protein Kisp01_71580 [Kineosporia sp. NBRC 101677]|uniref:hypothetical protein n=1 Tax=Kineosporia sp. NBRC 101677 TaxID=3032197 RepID=UPI0024A3DFCB|nr:hypothetical protein [Kineosporia sp. NBRC 101677]GLY20144.1 hypothetical protein Kisp01_71580 [Kineosporia sp. NBRC 101677]